MAIEFNCPSCDAVLRAKEEFAGRRTRCPHCGEPARVPEFTDAADAFALEEEEPYEPVPAPTPSSGQRSAIDDFLDGDGYSAPPAPRTATKPRRRPQPSGPSVDTTCKLCGTRNDGDATECRGCGERLGAGAAGDDGEINPTVVGFQEVFQSGWDVFAANIGPCIGGYLISSLLLGVGVGLAAAVLFGSFIALDVQVAPNVMVLTLLGLLAMVLYYVICFFIAGQLMFFSAIARGESPDFSLLFKGFPFTGRVLLISILYGFAVLFGLVLFIVPGILVALIYFPAMYIAVDRDVSTSEAIGIAGRITSGNKGTVFLIMLAAAMMSLAASVLQGLGHIILTPFLLMLYIVMYRMMAGLPVAEGK